jgi:quinol monooxygenase YgiN
MSGAVRYASPNEETSMIIVTGDLRVAPENMDRLRPLMRTVIEANRQEDGCLLFAFGEDVLDPGLIRVTEHWRDRESLAAHSGQPHVISWRAALKEIGIISRHLAAYDATNGETI